LTGGKSIKYRRGLLTILSIKKPNELPQCQEVSANATGAKNGDWRQKGANPASALRLLYCREQKCALITQPAAKSWSQNYAMAAVEQKYALITSLAAKLCVEIALHLEALPGRSCAACLCRS
jgi:hypothetical protein